MVDNMDNSSPFKLLRQKFVEDLEEILECPVCLERLKRPVVQCRKGHHICKRCYKRLVERKCPLCLNVYRGTRNFLAQNLITKFEEIKTSLIDPTHNINETVVKDKMSMGTQTSPRVFKVNVDAESTIANQSSETSAKNPTGRLTRLALKENENNQNKSTKNENKMPIQTQESTAVIQNPAKDIAVKPRKAKFRCQIGSCNELLSHDLMISHIKKDHAEYFLDAGVVQGNVYTNKWKIQYRPYSTFDQAIQIDNMGMFFVKIVISKEGDVHGHVQLNNIAKKAQHFRYSLNVGKNDTFISYKGKVLGSRVLLQNIPKGLFIPSTSMKDLIRKLRSFDCVLKIKQDLLK